MSTRRIQPVFLVALLAAVLTGCPAGGSRRPFAPVTATVTYNGSPVAEATVTFILEGGEPSAAFGKTDAQGIAKPRTPDVGEGVVLGKQKVTIIKEQIINDKPVASQDTPEYIPPVGSTPVPQTRPLIPPKYSSPGTSPLTVEVTSGGPNAFTFELTD